MSTIASNTRRRCVSANTSARRSNLLSVITEARQSEFRTIENLAHMAQVTVREIEMLERGSGPVSVLNAVMNALPLRFAGIGAGFGLGDQLKACREKKGLSREAAALKTGVNPKQIAELENGRGDVSHLLSLLSFLAPKIARAGKERAFWSATDKAQRDSRFTPPEFLAKITDVFGPIDLDPCGHASSPVVAKRCFLFSEGDDGLIQPWSGRFVFVNPPYSALLKWLRRAYQEWHRGAAKIVACLVPLRMDSPFFHETVVSNASIFILEGRLKFLDPAGGAQQTPFSLMLVVFGATQEQKRRFAESVRGFWMAKDTLDREPSNAACAVRALATSCVAAPSSAGLPAEFLLQSQSDLAAKKWRPSPQRRDMAEISSSMDRLRAAIAWRRRRTISVTCVVASASETVVRCKSARAA